MAAFALELEPTPIFFRHPSVVSVGQPTPARLAAAEWVRWLSDHTGTPWFGWSADTGELLARSPERVPAYWPYCNGSQTAAALPQFVEPEPGLLCCQYTPVELADAVVLTSYVLGQTGRYPAELVLAAVDQELESTTAEFELADIPVCSRSVFCRLVTGAIAQREAVRKLTQLSAEVEAYAERVEVTRAEVDLIHSVTQQLRLSTSPKDLARFCLSQLQSLMTPGSHVVALQDESGDMHLRSSGPDALDQITLCRLLSQFENHDWTRPLLRNHLSQTLLGADFPGLDNFAAVAIADGEFRRGWIVSTNLRDDGATPTQANVLQSAAQMLATHVRNVELYDQHEDLMVRFTRSLVWTLDAKDPYTRGHSERVALIARRLGQELGLPESDLDDIHLSGLLHDIGKVGIDDRILQKPDQLTESEFRHIQKHPLIGYQILHQIGNLQHILAGVRNHHETWNGRGYPDQLKGEDIPLMARIMSVADSYDAMVSDRPYRRGMPRERLEEIFQRGAGHQWDPQVIAAYFAARDDIRQLCENYAPEQGNLLQERSHESQPVSNRRSWIHADA